MGSIVLLNVISDGNIYFNSVYLFIDEYNLYESSEQFKIYECNCQYNSYIFLFLVFNNKLEYKKYTL